VSLRNRTFRYGFATHLFYSILWEQLSSFFRGGWAHNLQAVRGGWAHRSQAPATICPIDLYGILWYIIAMSIDIERSCYHARNS
jgi:hypothetical protein